MFYDNELEFLCDTFKKSRVYVCTLTPGELMSSVRDAATDHFFFQTPYVEENKLSDFLSGIKEKTMYKTSDSFGRRYVCLLLPDSVKRNMLFIGPYLCTPISSHEILEIGEKNNVSPKSQQYLNEYYSSLPVLAENSHLFIMLETFCERIWNSPSFAIIDLSKDYPPVDFSITDNSASNTFDDTLVNMNAIEARYKFENEIIQAVTLGQIHKESRLLSAFSENLFEKRVADPLRNAKNYGIIMNTLLRKAAEAGGVHPIYLDRMSSSFASKIEHLPSLADNFELMREMFGSYCRLVRKHSMKDYSLIVQKTILLIDSDLSANLSLSQLAESQSVSLGYLSTIFKKDTGQTICEYIREKRINHAMHLLRTTHLQIQTIALHCGVMDVQYFSKIFKKQTGKTPKEYRETIK